MTEMSTLQSIRVLLANVMSAVSTDMAAEEVAEIIDLLEDIKNDLKFVRSDIEKTFITIMGDTYQVESGGHVFSVSSSAPRKAWDHESLKKAVVERLSQLAINQQTGEVELTPAQAVDRVLEYAHVDYWRSKQLKELDLNPDMFCTVGEEKLTVRIERA